MNGASLRLLTCKIVTRKLLLLVHYNLISLVPHENTAYFTPLFSGFLRQIRRRKPRAAQLKLAKKLALPQLKSFKKIGEVFEDFFLVPC